MDRTTTRDEYKAFMRHWRACFSQIGLPADWHKMDKSVTEPARNKLFGVIYKEVPAIYWSLQPLTVCKIYRTPTDRIDMRMNYEGYCPNSYPHETRNP